MSVAKKDIDINVDDNTSESKSYKLILLLYTTDTTEIKLSNIEEFTDYFFNDNTLSESEKLELETNILNFYFDNHDNQLFSDNLEQLKAFSLEYEKKHGNDKSNESHLIDYIQCRFARAKAFEEAYDKKYKKLTKQANKQIKELIKKSEKLDEEIKETEKKALEKMAIFIAMFTLVAGNVSILFKGGDVSARELISLIFIINGTLILSIQTLFKLIGNQFSKGYFLIPVLCNFFGILLLSFPNFIIRCIC